jgi:hypothetical protein
MARLQFLAYAVTVTDPPESRFPGAPVVVLVLEQLAPGYVTAVVLPKLGVGLSTI